MIGAAKVLIAEDSLVIRAVLREELEAQGYTVVEAADGEEALAASRAERPDVVLLDIEMPGLDGYQVLGALKADAELAEVPVVFLTGRTDTEDIVEGLRLGAHDYLKKPFEASELIARVAAAARVKMLQDELHKRNAELDLVSRVDTLTQLHNRRHVDERLRELSAWSRRHGEMLSILMLDIDHFKQVNDTVGHAGGDDVLREFSSRLREELRTEDICGRWGGEEFLVLLPGIDVEGALVVAQRVCDRISSRPFTLRDGQVIAVTVSGGCAAGDGCDSEALVKRADDALYAAKAAGRNRIELARN